MKNNAATYPILIIICASLFGACSGSGSSPGATTPVVDATGGSSGDDSGTGITIAVTSPVSGNEMETSDDSVVLEGTAESSFEITQVSWSNDRGGEGDSSGSAAWQTSAVPLQPGDNKITITARDSSGAAATHEILIKKDSGATGSITLSWEAPTTREDGSPLTDLSGYRIRYGRMSKVYDYEIEIDNPGILTYIVEGLEAGEWHFAASAYDSSGVESDLSNEAAKVIPPT
jgi:hypothetical protein